MGMKARILTAVFFSLSMALTVSLFFNYKQYRDAKEVPTVRTETVIKWHEKPTESPQATTEREVGRLSVPIAKRSQRPRKETAADSTGEASRIELPDTIMAELPITQKVYEDSCYTAYVSGYQPNLDSIRIRYPTVITTVTKNKETKKFRRWNVGVIGGYGYGIKSKSVEPFIGIGVTVSLF